MQMKQLMLGAFFAFGTVLFADTAEFSLKQASDVRFNPAAAGAQGGVSSVFDQALNRDVVKLNYALPPGTDKNRNLHVVFPEASKLQWESIESITLDYQGGLGHCAFIIVDRDGEVFGYKKRHMLGGGKWVSYTAFFTDPNGKSYHTWGGKSKRNGIMDPPLRLSSLNITIYPAYIAGQLRGVPPWGIKPTAEEIAKGMKPVDLLLSGIRIKGVKYNPAKKTEKNVSAVNSSEGVSAKFEEIGTVAPLRKGNSQKLKYTLTNPGGTELSVAVSAASRRALTLEPEQKDVRTVVLKAGETKEITLPFDYSRPGFYDVVLNLSTGKTVRTFVSTWEPVGNSWKDTPETFFATQCSLDIFERAFGPYREQDYRNMRDAGVKLVRFVLRWRNVEPEKGGPLNWSMYDKIFKALKAHGLTGYPIISNAPVWSVNPEILKNKPGFAMSCAPDNKLFAEFAAKVADRYRDYTDYYQIWNEPYARHYYWGGDADSYADMLKQSYAAVKKVNPKAKICAGAAWDEVFFKAKGSYDFWPFHCHGDVEALHAGIARHRKMAGGAKADMSVFWNDETGFAVDPFAEGAEIKKASEICKKAVVNRAEGISNHVWFVYRGSPSAPTNPRDNYPSVDEKNRCRPVVAAHNNMVRMIRQSKSVKNLFRPGTGDAVLFKAADRNVLVFWRSALPKGQTVTVKFAEPVSGTLYNLFGSELQKLENASVFSTALTEEPQYLVLPAKADVKDFHFTSLLNLPYQWIRKTGDTVQRVDFQITNPLERELCGTMRFFADGGWSPDAATVPVKVAPGKTFAGSMNFSAGKGAETLAFPRFEFQSSDETVRVAGDLKFVACTPLGKDWLLLADAKDRKSMLNLRTGDVDADMFWQGADDLSAKIYSKWDGKYLYLKAEVRDNIHYQIRKGFAIFEGDSIQIAFRNAVGASRAEYRQFGFALNNDGEKTFAQWRGKFTKEPDFSVARKGMLTVYEVRIPWSELNFKPEPGNVFELSVLVNDNDGRARKVLLEWGGGIHGMRGKPMNPLILK